jgi:hypothetical protein
MTDTIHTHSLTHLYVVRECFIIEDKERSRGIYKKGCRCGESRRGKDGEFQKPSRIKLIYYDGRGDLRRGK